MAIAFDLRLVERLPDRVRVAVHLKPGGGEPESLDGVAVELFSRCRDSLSPRLLLPIAGVVHGEMSVTVELRASQEITPGALVIGTAWSTTDVVKARCPADPSTHLGTHVRGNSSVCPCAKGIEFASLGRAARRKLGGVFPWLLPSAPCGRRDSIDAVEIDEFDDISDELGLCDEDAKFLKELLASDE